MNYKEFEKIYYPLANNVKPGEKLKLRYTEFSRDFLVYHVMYVVNSCVEGRKLIICKVYGKHKQWWHEFMFNTHSLATLLEGRDRNLKPKP